MSCCSSVFFVFLLTAAVFSEAISGRLRHSETRVCRRLLGTRPPLWITDINGDLAA